jgi:hypothetical protein
MATDHYCTVLDVNVLAPQVPFTDTSKPSLSQVTDIIEDVALEMDARLANIGYTVPVVSGAKSLKLLRRICAYGALGLAQLSRDTGVSTAVSASGKEVDNIWTKRYQDRLDWLADAENPFELPDAPRTGDAVDKDQADVLRSMSQGITDDPDYVADAPNVTRNQVL